MNQTYEVDPGLLYSAPNSGDLVPFEIIDLFKLEKVGQFSIGVFNSSLHDYKMHQISYLSFNSSCSPNKIQQCNAQIVIREKSQWREPVTRDQTQSGKRIIYNAQEQKYVIGAVSSHGEDNSKHCHGLDEPVMFSLSSNFIIFWFCNSMVQNGSEAWWG